MPAKKKGSSGKKPLLVILVVIGAFALVAWHDGVVGTTAIRDINQGDVGIGTKVVVKGYLKIRIGNVLTVSDGEGHAITFVWDGTVPPLQSVVVVRGTVQSIFTLEDVTAVETAWLFK